MGSGKTTVAKILAGKKYPLFNADLEVKKIYKKNIFKKKIGKKFNIQNKKNLKYEIKKIINKKKLILKN